MIYDYTLAHSAQKDSEVEKAHDFNEKTLRNSNIVLCAEHKEQYCHTDYVRHVSRERDNFDDFKYLLSNKSLRFLDHFNDFCYVDRRSNSAVIDYEDSDIEILDNLKFSESDISFFFKLNANTDYLTHYDMSAMLQDLLCILYSFDLFTKRRDYQTAKDLILEFRDVDLSEKLMNKFLHDDVFQVKAKFLHDDVFQVKAKFLDDDVFQVKALEALEYRQILYSFFYLMYEIEYFETFLLENYEKLVFDQDLSLDANTLFRMLKTILSANNILKNDELKLAS